MFGIFGFLGFILILILFIILIVIAFLGNILQSIFGLGRRAPKHFHGDKHSSAQTGDSYSSSQQTQSATPNNGKKKIFTEDEGEYVEFEEVQ